MHLSMSELLVLSAEAEAQAETELATLSSVQHGQQVGEARVHHATAYCVRCCNASGLWAILWTRQGTMQVCHACAALTSSSACHMVPGTSAEAHDAVCQSDAVLTGSSSDRILL